MREWAKWDIALSVDEIVALSNNGSPQDTAVKPAWNIPMLESNATSPTDYDGKLTITNTNVTGTQLAWR